MRLFHRAIVGAAAVALVAAGCGSSTSTTAKITNAAAAQATSTDGSTSSTTAAATSAAPTARPTNFTAKLVLGKAQVSHGLVTQTGTFSSSSGRGQVTLISKGGNGQFESSATLSFGSDQLTLKGHSITGGAADPGSYSLRGKWKITRGSGKFRHASSTLNVLGVGRNDLSSTTIQLSGTL
jgi:hypothetical protein